MTIKKYQVNIFVGSQSYILRTNSLSEIKQFSGIKKTITAQNIATFLSKLNDQVFGTELGGSFSRLEAKSKRKGGKKSSEVEDVKRPDYVAQILERLEKLGAKTVKQQIRLFNKLTGHKLTSFKKLNPIKVQASMIALLKGDKK